MNENVVEQAALGWFESLGFDTRTGADISPGSETPLRGDYEHVVLEPRLRAALRKINGHLPEEAIEQAGSVVHGGKNPEKPEMRIKKPLIRQAGSAGAFVGSAATGREHSYCTLIDR